MENNPIVNGYYTQGDLAGRLANTVGVNPNANFQTTGKTGDPVIANSTVRRYTGAATPGQSTYDTAAGSYFANTDKSQPDPAAIRQQMLDNVQKQVDAIKNTSAGLIANAQVKGEDNLGKTRAISARSGNLGSDFGDAELKKTGEFNDAQIKALEDERDLKISGILDKVNTDAQARVDKQKETAAKNSEDYLSYLKTTQDTAKSNALGLAKSGADLTKLSDSDYNNLVDTTGMTPEQLKDFFILNKPEDKILTSGTVGNQYYSVSMDPTTGKKVTSTVTLPFAVPEGYTTQKLDDGTVIFVPSKLDPTKSLDSQILSYGIHPKPVTKTGSGSIKPVVSGSLKVSADEISQGVQMLNSSKGTDNFVDPTVYEQMYNAWLGKGGKPQDFISQFPPKQYVNPANNTLPTNLRSATAKKATSTGNPFTKNS